MSKRDWTRSAGQCQSGTRLVDLWIGRKCIRVSKRFPSQKKTRVTLAMMMTPQTSERSARLGFKWMSWHCILTCGEA
jgi:hypothetical protein